MPLLCICIRLWRAWDRRKRVDSFFGQAAELGKIAITSSGFNRSILYNFFRDFCHSCVFTEDMVRIKMIWDRFLPHRNTFTSSLFPLRCTLLNIYKRTEIIESWWCRSQLWPWDQECHWSWALAARMAIQSYSDWSPLFDDKQFLQSLPLWISTSCTFVTRSQPSGREFSGLQLRAWFSLTIPWPIL